jgi:cellulose synthase (UDP-forming)
MRSSFEGEEVMLAWNVYNATVVFVCVMACIDLPVRRKHDRFPLETIACLRIGSQVAWGVTRDLSEGGLSMVLIDSMITSDGKDAVVELPQGKLTLPSKVLGQRRHKGYSVLRLGFLPLSTEQEAALIHLLYNEHVWFHKLKRVGIIDSFLIMIGSAWRAEPLVRRFR